ncbi:MAG: hypothetical protein EAX96_06410 [Candidatus Lokiarchaeota archaeon]|nr:hypothetical protein [Candidatus Lokiarchaeota archaeon]
MSSISINRENPEPNNEIDEFLDLPIRVIDDPSKFNPFITNEESIENYLKKLKIDDENKIKGTNFIKSAKSKEKNKNRVINPNKISTTMRGKNIRFKVNNFKKNIEKLLNKNSENSKERSGNDSFKWISYIEFLNSLFQKLTKILNLIEKKTGMADLTIFQVMDHLENQILEDKQTITSSKIDGYKSNQQVEDEKLNIIMQTYTKIPSRGPPSKIIKKGNGLSVIIKTIQIIEENNKKNKALQYKAAQKEVQSELKEVLKKRRLAIEQLA